MIRKSISLDFVVDYLNDLIKIDRPAIAALIANRVPCNMELAEHESVQCGVQNGGYHVGMLGVINGIFGVDEDGWGAIIFVFDKDGNLSHAIKNEK